MCTMYEIGRANALETMKGAGRSRSRNTYDFVRTIKYRWKYVHLNTKCSWSARRQCSVVYPSWHTDVFLTARSNSVPAKLVASNCRLAQHLIPRFSFMINDSTSMDSSIVDQDEGRSNALCREHISPSLLFWANILGIVETTGFITPYLLHPIQGLHTYFPTIGGTSFHPESSIGDLAGKVILVTGGWSL